MTQHIIHEGILLDENVTYTFKEFCEISQVEEKVIIEMIEYGIVEPEGESQQQWAFYSPDLLRLKKAQRLHQDLDINWAGISLALDLLEEINELHQMIAILKKT